jgi:hypothetical protein
MAGDNDTNKVDPKNQPIPSDDATAAGVALQLRFPHALAGLSEPDDALYHLISQAEAVNARKAPLIDPDDVARGFVETQINRGWDLIGREDAGTLCSERQAFDDLVGHLARHFSKRASERAVNRREVSTDPQGDRSRTGLDARQRAPRRPRRLGGRKAAEAVRPDPPEDSNGYFSQRDPTGPVVAHRHRNNAYSAKDDPACVVVSWSAAFRFLDLLYQDAERSRSIQDIISVIRRFPELWDQLSVDQHGWDDVAAAVGCENDAAMRKRVERLRDLARSRLAQLTSDEQF